MVMIMMMIGMKTIINDDNNRMEVMLMKIQVVHHDASDKLFGYNTSSSMWQVPIFPPSQTIFRLTSIYHPPGRSPYSIYRKHFPSLHLKISNYHRPFLCPYLKTFLFQAISEIPAGSGFEYAALAASPTSLFLVNNLITIIILIVFQVGGRSREGQTLRSVFSLQLATMTWKRSLFLPFVV